MISVLKLACSRSRFFSRAVYCEQEWHENNRGEWEAEQKRKEDCQSNNSTQRLYFSNISGFTKHLQLALEFFFFIHFLKALMCILDVADIHLKLWTRANLWPGIHLHHSYVKLLVGTSNHCTKTCDGENKRARKGTPPKNIILLINVILLFCNIFVKIRVKVEYNYVI